MTCNRCHGTGYILIDEDEVDHCDHPSHRISDAAKQFAADPRFAHLRWSADDWQRVLDQEERAKNDSAHMRRTL